MGMRINTNTEALNTLRQLTNSSKMYATSMQRLSSGKRINSAADDAAGYAISQKLLAQSKGLDQASSNAQDGISLVQTAAGGLQTIQDMLQRLRQLAVQSANDTNTTSDRANLQAEADQISQEITQIGNTTQFNGKNLLDGSLGSVGTFSSGNTIAGISGTTPTIASAGSLQTGAYTFTISATGNVAYVGNGNKTDGYGATAVTANTLLSTGNGTALAAGTHTLTIAGTKGSVTLNIAGSMSYGDIQNAINQVHSQTGVSAALGTAANKAGIVLTADQAGTASNFTVTGDAANTLAALGLQAAAGTATTLSTTAGGVTAGVDGTATLSGGSLSGTVTINGKGNVFTDAGTGFSVDLSADSSLNGAAAQAAATITVVANNATLQVGANSGQSLLVGVNDMRAQALGVQGLSSNNALDISSSASVASTAIATIDKAISTVSTQAALLGATQNRLQNAIHNLGIGSENLQSAYSSITNVDMAKESTSLATAQILNQSGIAMLAQANQSPQLVLKLLG